MLIKNFIDLENILNGLNAEAKEKLVSNINFLLIKYINQQNKAELFNVPQKLADLLPVDKQTQLLLELNDVIIKYLNLYATESLFSIINNLSKTLDEENNEKALVEINDIVELFLKANSNIIENTPIAPLIVDDIKEPKEELPVKENNVTESSFTLPPPPPPPTFKSTPSIFTSTLSGMLRNIPSDNGNDTVIGPAKNTTPPPPPGPPVKGAPSVYTTTLSGMLKDAKINKTPNIEPLSLEESLKYIIPELTVAGKNYITDSEEVDMSEFLKLVNGKNSMSDLFNQTYQDLGYSKFIDLVHSCFSKELVLLKKSANMPTDKPMKLRTGEWLAYCGFIDKTLLERLLKIYKTALFIEENNRKYLTKDTENKETDFGDHLVEVKVITEEQLSLATTTKAQFNEIISNLK